METKQSLLNISAKYPLMRTQDYLKLLYQSEFLGGHMIDNEEESYLRLQREAEVCSSFVLPNEKIADNFMGITRVNLRPFVEQNKDLYLLNSIFVASSKQTQGSIENLNKKIDSLVELANNHEIDLAYFSLKREINEYKSKNYPVLSHSYTYKKNYSPAYRVVKKSYWQLFDVIEEINKQLVFKPDVVVAIEGNSATGKSYMSQALKEYYDCNVIKTDDFFLPFDMRTEERLQQVGGNIHYERLSALLKDIKLGKSVEYYSFDCHTGAHVSRKIEPKRLTVVEGCYSLHDSIKDEYDVAILLTANKAVRQRRIFLRDGGDMLQRFVKEWIPKENIFLRNLSVKKEMPLFVLDTSDGN